MRLGFGIHAAAVVGDRQHHVFARRQHSRRVRKTGVEFGVSGFDGQAAAPRHSVAGVDGQIQNHLFDLAAIRFDQSQIRRAGGLQLDVLADQPAQYFFHVGDDGVHIQNFRRQHLLTAEG